MKVVYFVRSAESGLIKIGRTSELAKRLYALSWRGGDVEVLAVIPDTGRTEREHHDRFAAHRVEGEWFRPDLELTTYVESVSEANGGMSVGSVLADVGPKPIFVRFPLQEDAALRALSADSLLDVATLIRVFVVRMLVEQGYLPTESLLRPMSVLPVASPPPATRGTTMSPPGVARGGKGKGKQ